MKRTHEPRTRGQAGFSLLEMLIAVAIMAEIMVLAYVLFDANNQISRAQTHVADMQQNLRVGQHQMVRMTRMAGRGGLPVQDTTSIPTNPLPLGLSVSMMNNVDNSTFMIPGDTSTKVVQGTDVLILRGVFTTPVYVVDWRQRPGVPAGFSYDDGTDSGTVRICYSALTGVEQDLTALEELLDPSASGDPVPLIVVSAQSDLTYAVVEVNPGSSSDSTSDCDPVDVGGTMKTGFLLSFVTDGGAHTADYKSLTPNGTFPASLEQVAFVGLLEEHRYWIREDRAIAGDASSELVPVLTQSRFFPTAPDLTSVPTPINATSRTLDLADNIIDLQISLGIDTDGDGDADEDPANKDSDELLFNDSSDVPLAGQLRFIRLSTLAVTDRLDRNFDGPSFDDVEDRDYSTVFDDAWRQYRRRSAQTIVSLRNPL